jgi:hypothetical protein
MKLLPSLLLRKPLSYRGITHNIVIPFISQYRSHSAAKVMFNPETSGQAPPPCRRVSGPAQRHKGSIAATTTPVIAPAH